MKNFIRKKKWIWAACFILVLLTVYFLATKIIYVKLADTSWIGDLGYTDEALYHLKLDRAGCPLIPIIIDGKTYYFNFDTGCATGIVVTNALENKMDYIVLEQIEQLNRDGSHRGWSYGVSVKEMVLFQQEYNNVNCPMIDWKMSSSYKFNGLVGTELFQDKTVTIDYRARMVGVSKEPLHYEGLSKDQYAVVPMLHTQTKGQGNLVFFECKLNDENVTVYIDTGKNISYIHNSECKYTVGESTGKPDTDCVNVAMDVGGISLDLQNVYEAKIPQYSDFNYPVTIELNSDQFLKNDIVITFDFINRNIIFWKR